MDYKSQTCCFTGHRNIAPYTPDTVFEQTKTIVTLLVSKGFKYFGTGGALGFDTIAAQAVLSVKETHPEVKLILVLPCENQTKYWKQQDIDVYNDIKSRADKVKVLAPHYYNGCMQKRNRHLIDCSSACICFLTKHEGGTAYTVDYAKQNGLDIISEEIFSTVNRSKNIRVRDRATLFNLLIGLNGYTVCSSVIDEELNGENIIAVPLDEKGEMHIGYITHKNSFDTKLREIYIKELKKYTSQY